jgi:hypothetical protein
VLAKVQSAAVLGVEAYGVCAEVDVTNGLPGYHLVGLGAGAVKEGGVRVRAALNHSGWKIPPRKVTSFGGEVETSAGARSRSVKVMTTVPSSLTST